MAPDHPVPSVPPRPDVPSGAPSAAWAAASSGAASRSRPNGRVLVAAGTALAVAAAAVWFVFLRPSGPTGPSVALAVSFSSQRPLVYRMSVLIDGHVSVAGQQVDVSGRLAAKASMRPVATDADGVTTIVLQVTHARMTVNGQTKRIPGVRTRMRISPDGEMVGGQGSLPTGGDGSYMLPGSDQMMPLLPDHPVRIGETWTDSFDRPFPIGEGSIHYSATSHFDRFEPMNGVRAAVVESDGEMSMEGLTMDARKALAASGGEDQLPPGVNPRISFGGGMDLVQTAWIDLRQQELLKFQNYGPFHITMGFEGVPGAPSGEASFDGRFDLSLVRLTGGERARV